MKRGLRGSTIVELMMACFLLSVVLLVSGRLAWLASRSKSTSESQNLTFRQASIALERIQREALHTQQIYGPTLNQTPTEPRATSPLVFRSRSGTSTSSYAVIAYFRDPASEELRRFTYRVDFNPSLPSSQVILDEPKAVATGVTAFEVSVVDPLTRSHSQNLSLRLVVRNKAVQRSSGLPLATEIRLAR